MTLLASCLAAALSAQAYRPFPEGNATWIQYHDGIVGSGGGTCTSIWAYFHRAIFFGADTAFDGHTYHMLRAGDDGIQWCPENLGWQADYHNDPYDILAIRQDTSERKVYGAWPGSGEWLLFDFGRDVGDTIHFPHSDMVVDSIYMMPLTDGDHRAFDLVCIGCGLVEPTTTMIEGVGATFTISGTWDIGPGFEYGANLECFTQEFTTIFTDTIDGPPICDPGIAMHTSRIPAPAAITVFPNPALDIIRFEGDLQPSARYAVFDAMGALVSSGSLQHAWVACNAWPTGLYAITLSDVNGTAIGAWRIVKE